MVCRLMYFLALLDDYMILLEKYNSKFFDFFNEIVL